MSGSNGNTPHENLIHLRGKPVHAESATPERSKCPAHPTKRAWSDALEAIREAESRSEAARMPIVAYKCDACESFHLCKRANARAGTVAERPEPERNWEVFTGTVAMNGDAKRKVLRDFLAERTEASTDELVELLGVGRKSLTAYMRETGWHNTRGRNAKWVPASVDRKRKAPAKAPRHLNPVDEAIARHPSSLDTGWRAMGNIRPILHMPLGDLLETFRAAGMEIRIQVREN
jgi:hypothetical protein